MKRLRPISMTVVGVLALAAASVSTGATGHASSQPGATGHASSQPGATGHASSQPGATGHASSQPGATGHASSHTASDDSGYARYEYPLCSGPGSLCTDAYSSSGSEYVGHDEPSIEFKSSVPGSGNDITYTVTLPSDPSSAAHRQRRRRHLELRAAADVLVRSDVVRQPIGARVHPDLHARIRMRTTSLAATPPRRITSASTRATRIWSCSSTGPATFLSPRVSVAPRPSTVRR